MAYSLEIAQLRYTKTQFDALNPTPASGQLCIETDTDIATTGDGVSAYRNIRGNTTLSGDERRSADDLYAAAEQLGASIVTPRTYRASISQSGSSDPVVSVLGLNTVGDIVWTRVGTGDYAGTLAGAFISEKTLVLGSSYLNPEDGEYVRLTYGDQDVITLRSYAGDTVSDGILSEFSVVIEVYQ